MANWDSLFEASFVNKPKQVFLATGEISALVWDKVSDTLNKYDSHFRVSEPSQLGSSMSMGSNVAYLLVDPTPVLLNMVERSIREGASDSFFLVFNGEVPEESKDQLKYVKTKAQQCKTFFTVTPPKTDTARSKMLSFFVLRWSVSKEIAHQVCSILEYSPGALYLFDRQFLLATDGQVYASSKTKKLVEELLGSDTPSLVVSNIVNGVHFDTKFDENFTLKVLKFLQSIINQSRLIHSAMDNGNTTVQSISKFTGIPMFLVLKSIGFAEMYRGKALRAREDLVLFGLSNYHGNPELLSTLARLWR